MFTLYMQRREALHRTSMSTLNKPPAKICTAPCGRERGLESRVAITGQLHRVPGFLMNSLVAGKLDPTVPLVTLCGSVSSAQLLYLEHGLFGGGKLQLKNVKTLRVGNLWNSHTTNLGLTGPPGPPHTSPAESSLAPRLVHYSIRVIGNLQYQLM